MSEVRTSARASTATALVVVAVLAGLSAGAWALWGGRSFPVIARNVELTGEDGRRAAGPLALADFETGVESYEHVTTFEQVVALKVLDGPEVDAYDEAGPGAARMTLSSKRAGGRVLVSAVQVRDHDAAVRTADLLDELQLAFGLERGPARGGVERVARSERQSDPAPDARAVVRAHYAAGDVVVRVEFTTTSSDEQAGFADVLDKQVKVLPADG
ncbi:hypothetical protein [Saccharothrix longispora]|uniref:hypothetical protein n=1 Tax=Saccharothrix longispora TaxID=33920 RepID=UPI0028FDA18F|nr:hypothetical protein [Saccharothrix longispora]MBY8850923.1 hypothetical protein [Saccharothrix sp. MB29]MDU0293450.1 hypothetical protein [Saccharothrix longispora]